MGNPVTTAVQILRRLPGGQLRKYVIHATTRVRYEWIWLVTTSYLEQIVLKTNVKSIRLSSTCRYYPPGPPLPARLPTIAAL